MATANATSDGGEAASASATQSGALTLDNVNVEELTPAEQKKYKELQADYTRKTQAIAEERKLIEQMKAEAEEYKNWWENNRDGIAAYEEWRKESENKQPEDLYTGAEDYDEIKKLTSEYEKKIDTLQQNYQAAMQQGYNQMKQLTEIKIADPDADWDKILKVAAENNIVDMRKAYNIAYDEKLTKKKIDEAVAEKEKELREKLEAQVLTDTKSLGKEVRKVIPRTRGR